MVTLSPSINAHLDRPIAVLGMGISGQSVDLLIKHLGLTCIRYDRRKDAADQNTFSLDDASQHGLAVCSPGFDPNHPWLELAREAGCLCLNELDFASLFWSKRIIGVTGTNGKTTLTEFLAFALRFMGLSAIAVGNNGRPLSSIIGQEKEEFIAVCEISSFQAESLRYCPLDALLWTNFDEDHLDRYASMRDYFVAKANLIKRLRQPLCFIGKSVSIAATYHGSSLPSFAATVDVEEEANLPFALKGKGERRFGQVPQKENFLLALAYWKSQQWSDAFLYEAAEHFPLPAHRLALIANHRGVSFWNDSKATNFAATLAALKRFSSPVLWLGGGKPKGGDMNGFVQSLCKKVKRAYLFGTTAELLARAFCAQDISYQRVNGVKEAVSAAIAEAQPGDDVLFSPGFSSLDHFSSFAERGNTFIKAVKEAISEN